jgi:peptide deformylase
MIKQRVFICRNRWISTKQEDHQNKSSKLESIQALPRRLNHQVQHIYEMTFIKTYTYKMQPAREAREEKVLSWSHGLMV